MLKDLKALGKESLIYGLSTVGARLLNFLLMPFYTHYLLPAEYGVVATVFSYIAFLNIIYQYGMDQAYMRHYSDRETSLPSAFYGVGAVSLVLGAALCLAPSGLAAVAGLGAGNSRLIIYSAVILFADALSAPLFADLRMAHKALHYSLLRVLTVVLNVGMNIFLIIGLGRGVQGIFEANICSSVLALALVMIPAAGLLARPRFSGRVYRSMLAFALPLVPAGLGSMAVQVIDRPILLRLADQATVGIYQANYRLGIFMMLVVSMFDQAWRPFFIERADKPDSPPLFARVLTFFAFGASWLTLALSFFIADLVKFPVFGKPLIHPAYWGGLGLVPVVLWAYVFNGLYINFLAPVIIAKRTGYMMAATFLGAAVNVGANFLLIPRYGMLGAAWATFAAYACMAWFMHLAGRNCYPVPYEWGRVFSAVGAGALLTCGLLFSGLLSPGLWLGLRLAAVFLLYPAFTWSLLTEAEKAGLYSLLNRAGTRGPAAV